MTQTDVGTPIFRYNAGGGLVADPTLINGTTCYCVVVAVDSAVQGSLASSEVSDTPQAIFRINAGGGTLAALDAGPAWEQDGTGGNQHRFLAFLGSDNSFAGDAVPDASVSSGVPSAVFLTERWSNANFGYEIPALSGLSLRVRIFLSKRSTSTSSWVRRTTHWSTRSRSRSRRGDLGARRIVTGIEVRSQ